MQDTASGSAHHDASSCTDNLCKQAQALVAEATAAGYTLGTAESITGGLIGSTITSIPGSSEVMLGGVISYASRIKQELLGVSLSTIEKDGVVSSACAHEMAQGVRKLLGCDIAVAVTGIAGPGGAEPGKPVGTVWFGIATPATSYTTMRTFQGTRKDIRLACCSAAIDLLRAAIVEIS